MCGSVLSRAVSQGKKKEKKKGCLLWLKILNKGPPDSKKLERFKQFYPPEYFNRDGQAEVAYKTRSNSLLAGIYFIYIYYIWFINCSLTSCIRLKTILDIKNCRLAVVYIM